VQKGQEVNDVNHNFDGLVFREQGAL